MVRASLTKLSDKVLLSRLHGLVKNEKQTTLAILLHLAEVDRRELYLLYGFSSLFDYCVGDLGYSRSAAGRRIASARCIRRYPEVFDLLDSGEVNLCTVGLVAPILDDDNKDLLLREIKNKSQRQVETIVARFKPPIAYRDRVKPVRVVVPQMGQNSQNRRNPLIFNSRCGSSNRTNCGIVESRAREGFGQDGASLEIKTDAKASRLQTPTSVNRAPTKIERRLLIQFLANEKFMAKLEEVKSLLSNKMPNGTFEEIFDVLMDEFIDRHSPEKRTQRREKRDAKKLEKQNEKHAGNNNSKSGRKRSEQRNGEEQPKDNGAANKSRNPRDTRNPQRTRHIPAAIRDKVFDRDNARCTFIGTNGKRCGSTHSLQIDHIKPFAQGGQNTLSNLRLLCGKHNRSEARRILGVQVMNQYNRRE